MKKELVSDLKNGVYRIFWKKRSGGGMSLGSIGRLTDGTPWMAPSNWITDEDRAIQTTDFSNVKKVELIESRY